MPALSIACPHCQTAIRLKSAASIGKKARCPKCQQVFVVPAAKAQEDEFAELLAADADQFAEYGGDEEGADDPYVEAAPSRSPAGRTKKGKKKRKSRGGGGAMKGVLITLAVLAVLGLLGGGAYLAVAYLPLFGAGSTPMAWLPDDTEAMTEIRVANVWNAPVLGPLKQPQISDAVTTTLTGMFGLRPEEIDRMVIAKPGSGATTSEIVTVVYSKAALTDAQRSAITGGATAVTHNGSEYFVRTGKPAVYLPRSDVAVFADETRIRAAIDSGGKSAAAAKFAFAPSGGDLTAVYLVESMAQRQSQLPAPLTGGASLLPGSSLSDDVRNVAVSVATGADLKIDARIVCKTAQQAESLAANMQSERDRKLTELQQQKSQIQPNPFIDADQLRALVESQEQMLSTMQMSSSGDTVRVSVTVPAKTIAALADMISMFSSTLPGLFGGGATTPTFPMPNQPAPYPGQ